jgi:4-hydroxybenzoate polyprenyltransferase
LFSLSCVGFFILCFTSSAIYILNDLQDISKDKNHPEKRNRPIASGKISIPAAAIISLLLLLFSVALSLSISFNFVCAIGALFLMSQSYSFYAKKIPYLDIIIISINFCIRTFSGIVLINYPVSYWLILSIFFIALFLTSIKRSVEVSLPNIEHYRPGFSINDKKILEMVGIFSATSVFIFFCIYCILLNRVNLLYSLPLALYITFIFIKSMNDSPEKIRNPEKFIFDRRVVLSLVIWALIVILALYL